MNGGIPQLGELKPHLDKFSADLQRSIPNVNFSGLAVIDFESWTPWFAEAQKEYREEAIEQVRSEHPNWSEERIEEQAREDFEWWARLFLEQTLKTGKAARPAAIWGYYQYPLCDNLQIANGTCPETVRERNDHLSWLLGDSDALYPSIYMFRNGFTSLDRRATVTGRLVEAERLAGGLPVLTYTWFQYHDDANYLSDDDLLIMLGEPAARGLAGAVMWGATSNCNTRAQCLRLEAYLKDHLGPVVRKLVALTPAERDTWRLLMESPYDSQFLRLVTELRSRSDPKELENGVQGSVTEMDWLTRVSLSDMSFRIDDTELNYLSDEDQGMTGYGDRELKMSHQQLAKMRKWQSSLDQQLWEVKRTQEKASTDEESGADH